MSDKQQLLLENLSKLPEPLQDKFLERVEGARMALDVLQPPQAPENTQRAGA